MAIFSLCSPALHRADAGAGGVNFGIEPKSGAYGLLYACFGLGAVIGALSIGTFLAGQSLETIVRLGLGGFAVALTAFALLRNPGPPYPMAVIVGFCLLRHRHLAVDRVTETTRRPGPRPGDGASG